MNVEMDLRQVVPLVLRATGSDYYIRTRTRPCRSSRPVIRSTKPSLPRARSPPTFSTRSKWPRKAARIVESMERLSNRYEEEAESALKVLTTIAGFAVWALVAGHDHPDDLPHGRLLHRHDQRRAEDVGRESDQTRHASRLGSV